ncbi:uncharacterized protein LOC131304413 [Rhododendron vialii]|uniref:uncharacterized protein LOC131304413 n=1 Tax=Rhododendron vialii TaxID=182163 RepID=UPI00265DC75C|nr:uncharacterized protein LOC131304413 [Rhododendron vialii]
MELSKGKGKAICVAKGKKSMLDGDLEKTVRFLQEKNVGVMIRDERELNQIGMHGVCLLITSGCLLVHILWNTINLILFFRKRQFVAVKKMLPLKWHLMIMLDQRPNAYDVNERERENAFNRGGPHHQLCCFLKYQI